MAESVPSDSWEILPGSPGQPSAKVPNGDGDGYPGHTISPRQSGGSMGTTPFFARNLALPLRACERYERSADTGSASTRTGSARMRRSTRRPL